MSANPETTTAPKKPPVMMKGKKEDTPPEEVPFYESSRARMVKEGYTEDHLAPIVVGAGDGEALTFTIPFKKTSKVSTYINKEPVGAEHAATLESGTGPMGLDQITFDTPPARGSEISIRVDTDAVPASIPTLTVDQKAALAVPPKKRTAEQKAIVSSLV